MENRLIELSDEQAWEIAELLQTFFVDADGERSPKFSAVNQIGGRGMLYQPTSDPPCPNCNKTSASSDKKEVSNGTSVFRLGRTYRNV